MATGTRLLKEDNDPFDQPSLYRSLIGGLQYLTLSRPDLAFAVNRLTQVLQHPTTNHWTACKRVLRYIKGTIQHGLFFKKQQHFQLEGYANADWATDLGDRRSTIGYSIFLRGNLVQWCSRKQKVVALSSTEAKYRALSEAATELVWIHNLFQEHGITINSVPTLWCDNMSAGALSSNPMFHARTKHIEIDVHYVRELAAEKSLSVQYVPSEYQVADVLTKALAAHRFHILKEKLTVLPSLLEEELQS
ncbi:secreted RxLR effector protein 161-like [Pistacia vera]|uniref:secreted RxLR effector protein 161-like n=1 Tax=Pistacia vera TaxID=55513 RepID=UPI001263944D|nr:secreted RxLR effector protein 161-like [Pistacia vera]